jgi:hypothetical protein
LFDGQQQKDADLQSFSLGLLAATLLVACAEAAISQ